VNPAKEGLMNLNLKTAQNMLRGLAAAICVLFVSAVPAAAIPDDLLAWWERRHIE
jgi:hypothetical protein